MKSFRPLTAAEQAAHHLRDEILQRRLSGEMPGIHQLAADLGVNHKTVKAALEILQKEGLLVSQGSGKPRRIHLESMDKPPGLRIAILLYEPDDRVHKEFNALKHKLDGAGHVGFFAPKTLTELKMEVPRVAELVHKIEADAWVVAAGSREVLDWFAAQDFPAFALFGRSVETPLANIAPKKMPAIEDAIQQLLALGHQRIVMIARRERREPEPGFLERAFLNELRAQGIPTGAYNLPDWEETPVGYQESLDRLFRHTPPTALFIQGTQLTVATLRYAAARGIRIPHDFSLISMDPAPAYAWCHPPVSHIAFDNEPWIRRIVQWARNIARGKDDRRKVYYPARFVEGGTIGPAKAT
jgi:hypothetical protein